MDVLIVGLGNPGPKYETTRHNAGFITLDLLADKFGSEFTEQSKFNCYTARINLWGFTCILMKPQTFYNRVGDSAASFARFYKLEPEDVIAIHDDIDTPAGKVKARMSGSHGGNNGVRSLIERLGTDTFSRIKLGIGRPKLASEGSPTDWVLNRFSDEELEQLAGPMFDEVLVRLRNALEQKK